MHFKNNKTIFLTAVALVVFGVLIRSMPHLPNLTPVTAIAFVGGLYLGKRWAVILPVSVMFISDLMIGFYSWPIMLTVYGSFLAIGFLAWMTTKSGSVLVGGLSVMGSSVFFFLVTNAAVWMFSPWYEKNFAGLLFAYQLGLPFFRNMLIGDLAYLAILVCAFELVIHFSQRQTRQIVFS